MAPLTERTQILAKFEKGTRAEREARLLEYLKTLCSWAYLKQCFFTFRLSGQINPWEHSLHIPSGVTDDPMTGTGLSGRFTFFPREKSACGGFPACLTTTPPIRCRPLVESPPAALFSKSARANRRKASTDGSSCIEAAAGRFTSCHLPASASSRASSKSEEARQE